MSRTQNAAFLRKQRKEQQGLSREDAGKSQEDPVFFHINAIAAADFGKNMSRCQPVPQSQGKPGLSHIGGESQRKGLPYRENGQIMAGIQYLNFNDKHLLGDNTRKGV